MSQRRYFGTDGIRGVAGQPPLTPGLVTRLGRAVARRTPGAAILGRDTRRSSPALRDALSAGLLADGADVVDIGVLPTPAVAAEVLRRSAAVGIVVTASHNPFQDNGIKVFGPGGCKLGEGDEAALEDALDRIDLDEPGDIGTWREAGAEAREAYLDTLRPATPWAEGLRIAVDAAHGAASEVAAPALAAAGAAVTALSCSPDGCNINEGCGALHPGHLQQRVVRGEADLGIALDGDADRCVLVGEDGELIDGDVMIALLALHRGLDQVVGTVMTNEGVVRHLADRGVRVHRAAVGDRNVLVKMRELGAVLGGESSGHVIQLDRGPTGDGLATALSALELRAATGRDLCAAAREIALFPSRLVAVRVKEKVPLDQLPQLGDAIRAAEEELAGKGRVLVRYSGTEPVLRVFVEGSDARQTKTLSDALAAAVREMKRLVR